MSENARTYYPTDLTHSQWELVEALLPEAKSGPGKSGRPASNRRKVLNGILYVVKSGCQWRMVPSEFGPWQTIYRYFNHWSRLTVWLRSSGGVELQRALPARPPPRADGGLYR